MENYKYRTGLFNRKVSFCTVTTSISSMGAPVKTFTHSFYWYMSREQAPGGQEQYVNNRLMIPYRFWYRGPYKSGINETMQIVDDGVTYNILSVEPTPDRMYMEIYVERITE